MKCYILSTYQEHGANNVRATLNKGSLPALLKALMKDEWKTDDDGYEQNRLAEVLQEDQCDPDGDGLSDGWGGVQLHIVELAP